MSNGDKMFLYTCINIQTFVQSTLDITTHYDMHNVFTLISVCYNTEMPFQPTTKVQ